MPLGPGSLDANGSWKYGEADIQALFSDLLNLGQTAESNKFASIATDIARRQLFTYRPASITALNAITSMRIGDTAYVVSTDSVYRYSGSAWVLKSAPLATFAVTGGTLSNGFTAGTNITYELVDGTVWLGGELLRSTAPASIVAFTLPVGFRPRNRSQRSIPTSGGATTEIFVDTSGNVTINSSAARSGTPGYVITDYSFRI